MNDPVASRSEPEPKNDPVVPPDPPTTQIQIRTPAALPWLLVVGGLAAIVALFATGNLRLPPRGDTGTEKAEWLQELAKHNQEFSEFLAQSRRQGDWDSARRLVDELNTYVEQLKQELAALNADLQRLEQTDAGRGLAARPELVQQFAAIRERERISPTDLRDHEARISQDREICDRALADQTIVLDPREAVNNDARVRMALVAQQLRRVQADRAALQSLVASAGPSSDSPTKLNAAAGSLASAQSQQALQRLAEEKAQLQRESEERIRAAELEAERDRLAAAERIRLAELEAGVRDANQRADTAEAAAAAAKERRARLARFEKQLPGMRALLSPMISTGRMQLDAAGNWHADEPGPLSLAVLQPLCKAGLERSGNLQMMNIFSAPTGPNDRPRGSWPDWGSAGVPAMRQAQQFIVDYGDLLVEKELLRP